jgi:hypothetical protein
MGVNGNSREKNASARDICETPGVANFSLTKPRLPRQREARYNGNERGLELIGTDSRKVGRFS